LFKKTIIFISLISFQVYASQADTTLKSATKKECNFFKNLSSPFFYSLTDQEKILFRVANNFCQKKQYLLASDPIEKQGKLVFNDASIYDNRIKEIYAELPCENNTQK